jgi:hypothetical protein
MCGYILSSGSKPEQREHKMQIDKERAFQDFERRTIKVIQETVSMYPTQAQKLAQMQQAVSIFGNSCLSSQMGQENYNISAVRALLGSAFTSEGLWRFCEDRPLLRPICLHFSSSFSVARAVDATLTYCRTHAIVDDLVNEIKTIRPRQYVRFRAELEKPEAGILVTQCMEDMPNELALRLKARLRAAVADAFWAGQWNSCQALCEVVLLLAPYDPETLRYLHECRKASRMQTGC